MNLSGKFRDLSRLFTAFVTVLSVSFSHASDGLNTLFPGSGLSVEGIYSSVEKNNGRFGAKVVANDSLLVSVPLKWLSAPDTSKTGGPVEIFNTSDHSHIASVYAPDDVSIMTLYSVHLLENGNVAINYTTSGSPRPHHIAVYSASSNYQERVAHFSSTDGNYIVKASHKNSLAYSLKQEDGTPGIKVVDLDENGSAVFEQVLSAPEGSSTSFAASTVFDNADRVYVADMNYVADPDYPYRKGRVWIYGKVADRYELVGAMDTPDTTNQTSNFGRSLTMVDGQKMVVTKHYYQSRKNYIDYFSYDVESGILESQVSLIHDYFPALYAGKNGHYYLGLGVKKSNGEWDHYLNQYSVLSGELTKQVVNNQVSFTVGLVETSNGVIYVSDNIASRTTEGGAEYSYAGRVLALTEKKPTAIAYPYSDRYSVNRLEAAPPVHKDRFGWQLAVMPTGDVAVASLIWDNDSPVQIFNRDSLTLKSNLYSEYERRIDSWEVLDENHLVMVYRYLDSNAMPGEHFYGIATVSLEGEPKIIHQDDAAFPDAEGYFSIEVKNNKVFVLGSKGKYINVFDILENGKLGPVTTISGAYDTRMSLAVSDEGVIAAGDSSDTYFYIYEPTEQGYARTHTIRDSERPEARIGNELVFLENGNLVALSWSATPVQFLVIDPTTWEIVNRLDLPEGLSVGSSQYVDFIAGEGDTFYVVNPNHMVEGDLEGAVYHFSISKGLLETYYASDKLDESFQFGERIALGPNGELYVSRTQASPGVDNYPGYIYQFKQEKRIGSFAGSVDTINAGESITLSWESSGSIDVTLVSVPLIAENAVETQIDIDASAGEITLTPTGSTRYLLRIVSAGVVVEEKEITVTVANSDSDGDGMPDSWELEHNLDPLVKDAELDMDSDLLTNLQEYQYQTLPGVADTDGDNIIDGQEVAQGLNPNQHDDVELINVDGSSQASASQVQYVADGQGALSQVINDEVQWSVEVGMVFGEPVVDDNRVYVACSSGFVFAINDNGVVLWQSDEKDIQGSILASPAISRDNQFIYSVTNNGWLTARNIETGKKVWTLQLPLSAGAEVIAAPGITPANAQPGVSIWLYVRDTANNLHAIDFDNTGVKTPSIVWTKPIEE